ncbi:MAG: ABC transporter permease [Pseudomonadota bacterium]
MAQALTNLNLIWLLLWLQFIPRTRRDSLKLFWVVFEPMGQLGMLMILFSFIGRIPGYGESFALFLLTGIGMLNIFAVGSNMVMASFNGLTSKSRMPQIGLFHGAIAAVIFKLMIAMIYMPILLYAVHYFAGTEYFPRHPELALSALFWVGVLSFGIGCIRGFLVRFAPAVERVYSIVARVQIFVAGVFYVPSFMPPQIRDILAWNPVLQLIELFRLGLYDQYPTVVFSMQYLQLFSLISVALGMSLIWVNRVKMMQ